MNIDWLSGFINGEGCFYISVQKNDKNQHGFLLMPKIQICLHKDENIILDKISKFLLKKYGIKTYMRKNKKYCIISITGTKRCIKMISLLKNKMFGKKLYNIELFSKAVNILNARKTCHTSKNEFNNIIAIKNKMNK